MSVPPTAAPTSSEAEAKGLGRAEVGEDGGDMAIGSATAESLSGDPIDRPKAESEQRELAKRVSG